MANVKQKCTKQHDENSPSTNTEIKEEGECSEDEEKSKDLKQVNQYSLGESRFLLEETTGMYYDQVTGYYYNLVSFIKLFNFMHCILQYTFFEL